MTPKLWFLAIFGILMCIGIGGFIIWDVRQVILGNTTISNYMWDRGKENPVVPALIGLFVGVIVGLIIGHLWWPRMEF
jgi:hypothetical protein